MSNVKISNSPVPFALPVASVINGTETLPMDQTVGGVVTTVSSLFSRLLGPLAVNYTTGVTTVGPVITSGPALVVNNVGSSDTAALNATSGRFTSLLFQNAGTLKGQVFWDNTNSLFVVGTSIANSLTFDAAGLQTTFNAGGAGQFRISQVQAGTANGDLAEFQMGSGATAFALFVANAANASALVTAGPIGASGTIRTLGNAPIVFGVNNHIIAQMSGSTTTAAISGWGPVAAAMVDMTPDSGSFTLTHTGFSTAVTSTATWSRNGNQVVLNTGTVTGTSNATTWTATGLPAGLAPVRTQTITMGDASDAGVGVAAVVTVTASSTTLQFGKGFFQGGAWTNTGAKGFGNTGGTTFSYLLN
jgi:hypothetical protein